MTTQKILRQRLCGLAVMLLLGGTAQAQHVIVGGNVFGGGNLADVSGTATVTLSQEGAEVDTVFGGGNAASVGGTATVSISNGAVAGGVYGGCNSSGAVTGAITISLTGGTVGTSGSHADVFGGGVGSSTTTGNDISVTLDGTTLYGDLYGGSAFGGVNGSTSHTTTLTIDGSALHGTIYGGGKGQNSPSAITATSNGNVLINYNTANSGLTGFYGGANINGSVGGNITVNVLANVGASGNGNSINIFGGGLGQNTSTYGNVTVTIGNEGGTITPEIYGDIYGGSALGDVNDAAADITKVDFLNGTLHGNIYGGGLGEKIGVNGGTANIAAKVNGQVEVNVGNSTQTEGQCHIDLRGSTVYGCNNTNGSPQGNVTVNIYKTANITGDYDSQDGTLYAIDQVFGGGNQADYLPDAASESSDKKTTVHIYDCKNTVRRVFSGGNAAAATGVATIIEGGRYDYVFGGGNGEVTAANIGLGGTDLTIHAGKINHLFGGSNSQGSIAGPMNTTIEGDGINSGCAEYIAEFFGAGNMAPVTGDIVTTIGCGAGEIGNLYGGANLADITGNVTLNVMGGTFDSVFGGSNGQNVGSADPDDAADIDGTVTLNLYGGTIGNAFGGSNKNGNITGKIIVNVLDYEATGCELNVTNIYGSGNLTPYTPDNASVVSPIVNVMHIKHASGVSGNVYGGGKGPSATVTANPKVNIGYDASTVVRNDTTMYDLIPTDYPSAGSLTNFPTAKVSGNVYGGGDEAPVTGATSILLQHANTVVSQDVYGGGNLANVSGATTLLLNGGTVTQDVYGGGALANTGGSTVTLAGATVRDLYGGGLGRLTPTPAIAAQVSGAVAVTVNSGTVRDVFGCNNKNGAPTSTVTVNINNNVTRHVYGGGNLAAYTGSPAVYINKGTVGGNVFGGGEGSTAAVTGTPTVTVGDLTVGHEAYVATVTGDVYGGGDAADVNTGTPVVLVQKCNTTVGNVYGGGNAADVPATNVTVTGGTVGYVFGGGHGDKDATPTPLAANVTGSTSVIINGGTITKVFGGSNSKGTIGGAPAVTVNKNGSCNMKIAEVYGGGNYAASKAGAITIGCTGTLTADHSAHPENIGTTLEGIGTIYGGANQADIGASGQGNSSNITLTISDGIVNKVYGGNNTSGIIYGDIQVNINKTGTCDWYVGDVFGGGNQAAYTGTPDVNIINGTVSGKVFGGGDQAGVGGGDVAISGGSVLGGLYGGCNTSGTVDGNITIALTGGTVGASGVGNSADVYGGGFGDPTQTNGNIDITLGNTTIYGDLYGGSALGDVNGSTSHTTTLNINGSNLNGAIYGGGKGQNSPSAITATSNGNVIINYNTANSGLTAFYGGANIRGSVAGNITVNVLANMGTDASHTIDIFGGGLGQNTSTNGNVTVTLGDNSHSPTIFGDVYGGSSLGEVGASGKTAKVELKAGTLNGTIYGGGMGQVSPSSIAATVTGGTEVDVSGGTVTGGLYGGGNINGSVAEAVIVSLTGGMVGVSGVTNNAVFGGGLGAHTTTGSNVTVTLDGATVYGALYGGSALGSVNDAVGELTTVDILSGEIHGNIYGGGLGKAGAADSGQVNGTIVVNIGSGTPDASASGGATGVSGSATIDGSVYGCNNTNGSPKGNVTVNIYSTDHTTTDAATYTTNIGSGAPTYAIASVFGGGRNASFTTSGKTAAVNVFGCSNTIEDLFGGGDAANVPGSAVTIWGGRYDRVFGGGNGAGVSNPGADIGDGGITMAIHGGNIGTLINASNEQGNIDGSITVTVDNLGGCSEEVDEFFGGSNMVDITGDVSTTIACGAGTFGAVYGGSNKAQIDGNVSLTIQGGTIGRVFGGSKGDTTLLGGGHTNVHANITGNVSLTLNGGTIGAAFGGSNYNGVIGGTITVNVTDLETTNCGLQVDSVFGAGNVTPYSGNPVVNINHGTVGHGGLSPVAGVVFGGGKGASAIVTGNPVVTIGDANGSHRAIVTGSVFGGGDAAAVTGSTTVTYNDNNADSYVGYLYGGGNSIVTNGVSGSTTVTLTAGRVTSGIYGGCNEDGTVGGNSTVNLNGGQVGASASQAEIFGGGYGASTEVSGNVHVTMGNIAGTYLPVIYGELYGGSALGSVNTSNSNTTTVDIFSGTLHGTIYGGGRGRKADNSDPLNPVAAIAALVNGVVHVNVGTTDGAPNPTYSGSANLRGATIYGCNNLNGSPQHDVYVDIYQTAHTTTDYENYTADDRDFAISNVYGGGNQADYAPTVSFRKNVDGLPDKYPHYKKVHVAVHGCFNTINEAYGGGNAAAVLGDSIVVDGGRHGIIFGGGNGEVTAANVDLGGVNLTAKGGHVGYLYEHCNKRGIILGPTYFDTTSFKSDPNACNNGVLKVDYHFCGGNEVDIAGDFVYRFTCSQNLDYDALYGGCRLGTTYGNITLIIEGGNFNKIYGGPRGAKGVAACVRKYPTDEQLEVDYETPRVADGTYKFKLKPETDLVYARGVHEYMYKTAPNSVKGTGGNVTIILKGGTVGRVYGGCEINGNVEGKITIVVDSLESSTCPLDINYLYGASDLAEYHPDDSTWNTPLIALVKGHVNNDVFGGGHGADSVINAGLVTSCPMIMMGNQKLDTAALRISHTQTLISTVASDLFWVKGNIYGGGEMGSVGKYSRDANGHPTACDDNTGKTTIVISKGKVGPRTLKMPNYKGLVFGGSKGAVGDTNSINGKPKISHLAFVNNTDVTIDGTAFIKGSVYGGGESGRVFHDTYVKIQGGQIGCGWDASQATDAARDLNRVYTDAEWNYDVVSNASKYLFECNSWDYTSPYNPYDPYETGSTTGHDGHTFYGNVFGGGSGMMPFKSRNKANTADSSIYIATSGRVYGSTKVDVSGGHILTSLYGGCELGDVVGDSSVVIFRGGTLGVPRTLAQIAAHPVTCYLFGAGKGDERVRFNKSTNVENTRVTVRGGKIYGSIFGGGEDGHVMRDVKVDVLTGADIGTWGTSYVDGNVFGGGRGFSGNALTAGNVGGDVEVNIKGGTMLGSIYGGGRLASVGYGLYLVTESGYGIMRDDDVDDRGNTVANFPRGHITVNISGGTIGNDNNNSSGTLDYLSDHSYGGNVFGGSMGRLTKLDGSYILNDWHKLGAAKQTTVNISGTAIVKGNVYGGSELGIVTENTEVNITGASVTIGRDVSGTLYHGDVYGGGYGSAQLTELQLAAQARRDSVPVYAGRTYGSTELNLTNGIIYGSVFGGGERASIGYEGNASLGNTTVNIGATSGGVSPTYSGNATIHGDVYGANNFSGTPLGDVNVNIYSTNRTAKQEASYTSADREYALANVFGGGHQADYAPNLNAGGGTTSTKVATVHVYGCDNTIEDLFSGGDAAAAYGVAAYIDGGRFGRVFGGGNGEDNTADIGAGGTDLHIYGGIIDSAFGGGNLRGTITGPVRTEVDFSQSSCSMDVADFFGGSNAIDIVGNLTTSIRCGSFSIDEIYGGSNKADITGSVTLNVYGGTYNYVFGGSKGVADDPATPLVNEAKPANITGNVNLNLYGGDIRTAFGGSNINGVVNGVVTVTVDSTEDVPCRLDLDSVFGGGRLAQVNDPAVTSPIVNLTTGHVNNEVYGGGLGDLANNNAGKVTANPQVNMTGTDFHVKGSIYGGGSIAITDGSTEVNVSGGTVGVKGSGTVNGNVYGGGVGDNDSVWAGAVKGNTTVNISGSTTKVWHNVYGGGSLASVGTFTYGTPHGATSGNQITACADGTGMAKVYITGGTIGDDGHENGMVFGSSRGDIDALGARADTLAWVYATKVTIGDTDAAHNMTTPLIRGSVYGGGENGHVKNDSYVHIHSGQVGYQSDTPSDKKKNVDKNDPTYEFRGNVYGAGCGTDQYHVEDTVVTRKINGTITALKSKRAGHTTEDSVESVYSYNPYAGTVQGNARIKISGGHIFHNVYGGGAMGNVGAMESMTQYTNENDGFALSWPNKINYAVGNNKGYVHIDITGGRIGTMGSYDGDVFGGARGEAGDRYVMARYANVRSAIININYTATATTAQAKDTFDVTPCITGSVYGGAENGHIIDSTFITLDNGYVGHALYGGGKGKGTYTTHKLRYQKTADGHTEGDDSTATVYSITAGKVYGNTRVVMNGGHVGRNIFGGGNQGSTGKGNYAGGLGDYSSGGYGEKVTSDTAFWWSNFRSSGTATVIVTAGTVGEPSGEKDNIPLGNVFGGARGIAAPNLGRNAPSPRILYYPTFFGGYVNRTNVTIGVANDATAGPRIYGSVYGGGMDGHTRWSSHVRVLSGEIGNAYTSPEAATALSGTSDLDDIQWMLRGNVFGSGSGVGKYDSNGDGIDDALSNSSGSVTHFTTVDIEGGTIHRNVYGGGSLATVGPPRTSQDHDATIDSTLARVNISGGTIGTLSDVSGSYVVHHDAVAESGTPGNPGYVAPVAAYDETVYYTYGGNVFGGSRGQLDVDNASFSTVIYSRVDVSDGTAYGSVYGGGEIGTVKQNTDINISGGTIGDASQYNHGDADPAHSATIATYYNDNLPDHLNVGHVYGGGKGISEDVDGDYKAFCNVVNTDVDVTGGTVHGSVYGGAANGHVTGTTDVTIGGTAVIGTLGLSAWDGHVFGGGEGSGTVTGDEGDEVFTLCTTCGNVSGNTNVTMSAGTIKGSIYGGGRLALTGVNVDGDYYTFAIANDSTLHGFATVAVSGGTIGSSDGVALEASDWSLGDIFGSGRGDVEWYQSVLAGRVANTSVTVSGTPTVYGAVFGGGEMAGIGWWSDDAGHPFEPYTGTSTVNISGGTIGTPYEFSPAYLIDHGDWTVVTPGEINADYLDNADDWYYGDDPANKVTTIGKLTHSCTGNIIGGSQGDVDLNCPAWISMGRSRQTFVDISGNPVIMGNVYGGAEQGVVMENTHVTVSGGTIGTEIPCGYSMVDDDDDPGTPDVRVDHHYNFGSVFGGGYGSERWWDTVHVRNNAGVLTKIKHITNDSCVFSSNSVFDTTTMTHYTAATMIAGRVYGNTYVKISGGTIRENVYGGGNMASVGYIERDANGQEQLLDSTKWHGGICTVIICNDTNQSTGAITGPDIGRSSDNNLDHTRMSGHVYTAGKGVGNDPDDPSTALHEEHFMRYCNVDSTSLTVCGGHIYGSTFGGGADCHVLRNTSTLIKEGAYIGSKTGANPLNQDEEEYDGCVLGGGRNALNKNHTAGRVQGHTYVKVTGGRIRRTVLGGGAMARVGVDVDGDVSSFMTKTLKAYNGGDTTVVEDAYDSTWHGSTFVDVSGDTVQYASAAAFAASPYYANYVGTTREYGDGKVTVYKTTIGAFNGAVLVDNDYTIGDIFGGGKGDTKDTADTYAGRVMNTHVKVHGAPRVMADIYAGGEMSCIGWYDSVNVDPTKIGKYYGNTGYTKVNITDDPYGGTPYEFSEECIHAGRSWTLIDEINRLYHTCSGNVYGGGQGYVEQDATNAHNWVQMGRVRKTKVTIAGGRFLGNVFGGGSRGIVKEDCIVNISDGHFGCVIEDNHVNKPYESGRYYYGSVFGGGYGNHKRHLHVNDSCYTIPTGQGYANEGTTIQMVPTEYAGRVYGNTYLTITGGWIMDCVYGGGDMASTGWVERDPETGAFLLDDPSKRHGGVCNVTISGNTIVGPLDGNGHNAYVYGAGKGIGNDPDEYSKTFCNVNETHLTVELTTTGAASVAPNAWEQATDGGRIWGSLFGGGADCHVLGDVETELHSGIVGTDGTTSYDGNIFGAGRNYLNTNHTNGRVAGNVKVLMDGGTIQGTIFGGGRLALTGVDVDGRFLPNAPGFDVTKRGNVNIWVSGNVTIGTSNGANLLEADQSCGDIFGSGKGDIANYEDVWAGRVTNTKITVQDTTIYTYEEGYENDPEHITSSTTTSPRIYGSIFGGGEMASVGYWDDTIHDANGDPVDMGTGTNYSIIYDNTGHSEINISGGVIVGTALEYTVAPASNPGDWTIYNKPKNQNPDTLIHTCTGNVFGGCQGDVDIDKPRWISMGRSASTEVNISGGTFMGNVFGGTEQGIVTGNTRVNISGGTFGIDAPALAITPHNSLRKCYSGDIYAAGYGSDDPAEWDDDTDNDSTDASRLMELGWETGLLSGRTFGNSRVDVTGGVIWGSVYGGGSYASVGDDKASSPNHYYTPETRPINGVTTVNIGLPGAQADGSDATGSATIHGEVFGGNNFRGTAYGNTNVNIYKTAHTVANTCPTAEATAALRPEGADPADTELTEADVEALPEEDENFALSAVYGGGNRASHEPIADDGTTNVHVYYCEENTIKNVYGGGNAADTKNNHVVIDGGRILEVFGGGNGYSATGNHNNPSAPNYNPGANVIGTGTDANPNGVAHTEIKGGLITDVFGGSNSKGNIGTVKLDIENEGVCPIMVANTYGGGNEAEGGGGIINLHCGTHAGKFYGGSRNADLNGDIILNIDGGTYEYVFGGSKGSTDRPANINGNITVNVTGGHINNLFGGSDINGNITGQIKIHVDLDPDYDCPDGLLIEHIYGGSNLAIYAPDDITLASPVVSIINDSCANGKSFRIKSIFGGSVGNGTNLVDGIATHGDTLTGYMKSNPMVGFGGDDYKLDFENGPLIDAFVTTDAYRRNIAVIDSNIYGGGKAAPVEGNTVVMLYSSRTTGIDGSSNPIIATHDHDTTHVHGSVYGGGFGPTAKVTGNTTVGIFGDATVVDGSVYGGGEAAILDGSTDIQVGYERHFICAQPFITIADDGTTDIYCATPGTDIYYTTDGSEPTTSSTHYTGTFNTPAGTTVKALAVKTTNYNNIPGISVANNGVVTLSSVTPAAIYYLISNNANARFTYVDGVPTNGTLYNPDNKPTLGSGQYIKAIAIGGLYQNSLIYTTTRPTP